MSVTVAQINVVHSVTPLQEVHDFVRMQNKPVVVALQEPHINQSGQISVLPDSGMIFYRNIDPGVPRAAIYHTPDVPLTPHNQYMCGDMATALWQTNDHTLGVVMVVSLYVEGRAKKKPGEKPKPILPPNFKALVGYCLRRHYQILVLGDLNAHSVCWGEYETDPRGEYMENYFIQRGFDILNRGQRPHVFTYYRANAHSIIDVSLCTSLLSAYVKDWRVTDSVAHSDHMLIAMEVLLQPPPLLLS